MVRGAGVKGGVNEAALGVMNMPQFLRLLGSPNALLGAIQEESLLIF